MELETELWSDQEARIFGGPAISPDGRNIAFSVRQHGQTLLYVMQTDGTNARIVIDAVDLQGAPAWAPDGQSITAAADDHGVTHLLQIPVDGHPPWVFVKEYAINPTWAPDVRFVVYSGPDIGTVFTVKAVTAEAATHPMPALTLTRGARHLRFMAGGRALVLLRGDIQHKNLWLVDRKRILRLVLLCANIVSYGPQEILAETARTRVEGAIRRLARWRAAGWENLPLSGSPPS